ncbi:iron complex transport system ATP-binding protein [Streptococcus acidominimus]|uniref:Iron complex transport system ATP-binding protein n=1 Tax=Streptococcus acidominimus TaxID=1326 RepID=A0A239WQD6_STRAI|nr:ABC transporter ATP-binding protein [Streptococcus acidominimus]SNV36330.1 iron complex transport system ATP-binding protein [Streptococcus acidominimus]
MSDIKAQNISVAYDDRMIIEHLSLDVPQGAITTIIGANGCGKSTLLKALTRIHNVEKGAIYLDGQSIATLPTKQVAQKIALLPQVLEATEGISVYQLVSYGRYPHQKYLGSLTSYDRSRVHWAMEVTNTIELANQDVDTLSGGQKQRVWIAMALAQDTDTIFLDEPTTYLDLNHQLEVLELLKRLNQENGKTIVMVLHDLNLSARFSDQLIAMKDGCIQYQGAVSDILTVSNLETIFNIKAHLVEDPIHKVPVLLSYQLLP